MTNPTTIDSLDLSNVSGGGSSTSQTGVGVQVPTQRGPVNLGINNTQSQTDYNACVQALKSKEVDAVTTNDVILAGLAMRDGSGLHLNNAQFNEQRTGVGLRKNDVPGCEALNRAITGMYQDGTAEKLLKHWFGKSGLDLGTVAVPQFEGCS